jgi:nickel/cobalt transporter (NiCoT) family protein
MQGIDNQTGGSLRRPVAFLACLLIGFNLAAWAWALWAFRSHPLLMGTAFLAYGLGLRHAVDADHIAAIDNVTRKLMQAGQRPLSVGLYFSLGHSTVVVALSAALAAATGALQTHFAAFKAVGGVIGTSLSAFFLFAIAAVNLVILAATWRNFQAARRGLPLADDAIALLAGGGLLCRLLRRLFRLIGRSWHMYGLGLLFGLGFDTATEVGVLGLSATSAANGLSPWSILVFPALFSAGMALVDTADGVIMLGAYGWAFVKPLRKLYYNLTITALSVVAALLVGGLELLGLVAEHLPGEGPFWRFVGAINDNFSFLGYGLVAIFALGWVASMAYYRLRRFDELEAHTSS